MVGRRFGRCWSGLNDFGIDHRGLRACDQHFVGQFPVVMDDIQGAVQVRSDLHLGADQAALAALGWENMQPSLMVLAGELPKFQYCQ